MADAGAINSGGEQTTNANAGPFCQAILLCDEVTRDKETGKTSIAGIFDTFYVPSFPGLTSACQVFLLVRDVVGQYTLTAEIHDEAQGVVLFRSPESGKLGTPGQISKGEIWLPVSPLLFDRPGIFDLVVFARENEIGRVLFNVRASGA